jgi:ATP-dependent RNA helicase RhlE
LVVVRPLGKTFGFDFAMLTRLNGRTAKLSSQASLKLILSPTTRELAVQINDVIALPEAKDWSLFPGGCRADFPISARSQSPQARCSVIVATPGRLMDLLEKKALLLIYPMS